MKLLFDLFPVLLFFAVFKLYGIFAATAAAIAATLLQVGMTWLRQGRVERMHVLTLALVVGLGGATLLLQDESFIKWKPTAVNWLFALAFLASHFIGGKTVMERVMGGTVSLPSPIWQRLSLACVVFLGALGLLNLYVAFYYAPHLDEAARTALWVDFKLYGMLGLTFVFVVGQALYPAWHLNATQQQGSN